MSKHSLLLLTLTSTALGAVAINAHAHATPSADRWQAGVVLDGASTSRGLELGARDKGLGLGHSDLLVRGAFNEHFSGEAILGVNWECAQVSRINGSTDSSLRHGASSLGAVWKFNPAWEVGVRTDWLRVNKPEVHDPTEGPEFFKGRLKENAIMVAYKPAHMQTLRLQLTQQRATGANEEGEAIFANPARRSIQLQYVIGFGAHGAHSY